MAQGQGEAGQGQGEAAPATLGPWRPPGAAAGCSGQEATADSPTTVDSTIELLGLTHGIHILSLCIYLKPYNFLLVSQ